MDEDNFEAGSDNRFSNIPENFPCTPSGYSLSGLQQKLALLRYEGKFYEPGAHPHEVYERWDIYEDLAKQFAQRCTEVEHGKFQHLSRTEILEQYLTRLLGKGWGSTEEMKWVIRRTATLLGWSAPASANAGANSASDARQ